LIFIQLGMFLVQTQVKMDSNNLKFNTKKSKIRLKVVTLSMDPTFSKFLYKLKMSYTTLLEWLHDIQRLYCWNN